MHKTGRHLQGAASARHGAGTACQAYRTLGGITLVGAIRPVPVTRWPGHALRLPMGLACALQAALAKKRHVP